MGWLPPARSGVAYIAILIMTNAPAFASQSGQRLVNDPTFAAIDAPSNLI
jgi:hypothetical protein